MAGCLLWFFIFLRYFISSRVVALTCGYRIRELQFIPLLLQRLLQAERRMWIIKKTLLYQFIKHVEWINPNTVYDVV